METASLRLWSRYKTDQLEKARSRLWSSWKRLCYGSGASIKQVCWKRLDYGSVASGKGYSSGDGRKQVTAACHTVHCTDVPYTSIYPAESFTQRHTALTFIHLYIYPGERFTQRHCTDIYTLIYIPWRKVHSKIHCTDIYIYIYIRLYSQQKGSLRDARPSLKWSSCSDPSVVVQTA